jgi:hypothetical protein
MSSVNGSVVADVVDERRVEALAKAYDLAIRVVTDYLSGKDVPDKRVEVARITIAQWSKVRQTDNARAALNFMVRRHAAGELPIGATREDSAQPVASG